MSDDRKNLALAIIDFLKTSISEKVISEENVESIDVAVECIADAFEVDKELSTSVKSVYGGKSLLEIAKAAVSEKSSPVSATNKEVSAEDKTKAEALKAEGNKAIGAKDYDTAVAKYTEAIALDPYNVVYYSNRAAAYTSSNQLQKAVEDAEKAIELDPSFTKAYSRLGLAQYNLGNSVAAMKAYEKGIAAEGANASEAMKSGYETAKKRAEAELGESVDSAEGSRELDTTAGSTPGAGESGSGSGARAGGFPDFSSIFGGAGGAMPSLADMMSNPQVMQAAQNLMSNPGALQGLMNNPEIARMAQNLGGEGGLEGLMNNPMLRNMANQFMGGAGGAGNTGNNGSDGSSSGSQ